MKTVTGLFDDYSDASAAVSALEERGKAVLGYQHRVE